MTLTRNDTSFLKGVAILLIAVHNFCHWLPMAVIENEYNFDVERIWKYLGYVEQGGPHLFLNFLSHFGHYGVPLFLFLSGYGLVKKYEREGTVPVGVGRFMLHNAQKLWKLMLPAILLFVLTETLLRDGFQPAWYWVPAMLSFGANLWPSAHMILGPWWFFSLIMQCYLLYRWVFFKYRSSAVLGGATLLTLAVQIGLYLGEVHFNWGGEDVDALFYLRYNAPGHLMSFALGIAVARGQLRFTRPWLTMAMGWFLLLTSAFSVWHWWLSPLYAVMALLPLAHVVRQPDWRSVLERVGVWSAAVFAFHPIVRQYLILPAGRAVRMDEPTLVYGSLLLYLTITLLLAWGYHWLTTRKAAKF